MAKLPVMLDSGRSDVVLKETAPPLPDLLVHQAIDMVKMNRLEFLEKLIGGMKKKCLLFRGQRLQIFKTYSPYAGQVGILGKRSRHFTECRCRGVLRGQLCYSCAAMHLKGEIKDGENYRDRANHLRDRAHCFPVHVTHIAQLNDQEPPKALIPVISYPTTSV